jgi:hypothetical protein
VVIARHGKISRGKCFYSAANNNNSGGESAAISAELLILDAFIS